MMLPAGRPRVRACALVGATLAALAAAGLLLARGERSRPVAATANAGLQSAVSTALGASDRRYWVVRRRGSLSARGGRLQTTFAATGVRVTASGGTVEMMPLGGPGVVAPHAARNSVSYARGAVDEWYRNGPLGLEQGVTIRRPIDPGAGVLTVSWRLGGTLTPRLVSRDAVAFLPGRGQSALRYSGLVARDSASKALPARIALRGGVLSLVVDAAGARYPVHIDPFLQQGSKLSASGRTGAGNVGMSLAVSADGNTALVGGPMDDRFSGGAWVFVRRGPSWFQLGPKLSVTAPDPNAHFGASVALSADGNTALIGGPTDNIEAGAAWVFTRSGAGWSQQGDKLSPSDETGMGRFGAAVALSADGNSALIGAPFDHGHVGASWRFARSGATWTQQGSKLTGAGESGPGDFGYSVALSSDARTALIGAPADDSQKGAVWIFTANGSTLTQSGDKLTGRYEVGAGELGLSVALSGDGATALIGSPSDAHNRGTAWVFTHGRGASAWTQQRAPLTGAGELGAGFFGWSVALSSDGGTAVVGAPIDDSNRGAAWAFKRSGAGWTAQGGKLTGGGEVPPGGLGLAVALSANGTTALLGGPGDDHDFGTAWVFVDVPRLAILGRRGFVSRAGDAGIVLGCFGTGPCKGSATVTRNGTVIGRLPAFSLAADSGAVIRVPLAPAARRRLGRSPSQVIVSVAEADGTGTSAALTLVPLEPRRSGAPAVLEPLSGAGFASQSGDAGVLVGCIAARPCAGSITVTRARGAIGRRSHFIVPPGEGTIVHVRLSPSARRSLDHAHALTVSVSIIDDAGRRTSRVVSLQELS
jgi:hypothetical protein